MVEVGAQAEFHDGIVRNGEFLPALHSLAPHRYEGQTGTVVARGVESDGRILYTVQFADGGKTYCRSHHLGGRVDERQSITPEFRARFDAWHRSASALICRWMAEGMSEDEALERVWGKAVIKKWRQLSR